jgi:hypothetical protein
MHFGYKDIFKAEVFLEVLTKDFSIFFLRVFTLAFF